MRLQRVNAAATMCAALVIAAACVTAPDAALTPTAPDASLPARVSSRTPNGESVTDRPSAAAQRPVEEARASALRALKSTNPDHDNPVSELRPPAILKYKGQTYSIEQLIPRDAIPAIYHPKFISAGVADEQFQDEDLMIGLSVNGQHRAYSIAHLSNHEIVNDVVGGTPVAVTW